MDLIITVFSILLLIPVQLKGSIILQDNNKEYALQGESLDILYDSSSGIIFEEIQSGRYDRSFYREQRNNDPKTRSEGTYWIRFSYIDQSRNQDWLIEFKDFRIDDIEVFIPDTSGRFRVYHQGDDFPFYSKAFAHKNHIFSLPKLFNKKVTVYARIKVTQSRPYTMTAVIRSYSGFTHYSLNEYFLLALFYGIILSMTLYNLFLFISIKDPSHLFYVFYTCSLMLFSLTRIDGLAYQYLWPGFPLLNQYADYISLTFFITTAILFAQKFLNTKNISSGLNTILNLLVLIRVLFLLLGFSILPALLDQKVVDCICLFSTLSIVAFEKKIRSRSTILYLVAFGFMFLGFTIYSLQEANVIENSTWIYYSLNLGIIMEVFLLSFAIADKTRTIYRERNALQLAEIEMLKENEHLKNNLINELNEKEKLKDGINKELEMKVAHRTYELKLKSDELIELNNKLEQQAEEINRMNSLLDKHNWELQKELNQKNKARIIDKTLSYEEFISIFPDDLSCHKYLKEIKWRESWTCTKCGSSKFSSLDFKNRKCNKCKHIESLTANTIFHGIKFSINKAFYLAYFSLHKNDKVPLTDISRLIDLRRNTCINFLNRIEYKKDQLKTRLQIDEITDLEKIILD